MYHLLRYLPPEAATVRELSGRHPELEWDTTDHLLAGVIDLLRAANWQRSGKGRKPKPIPRPGDEPTGRALIKGQSMSPAELNAELARRYKPAPTSDDTEEVED